MRRRTAQGEVTKRKPGATVKTEWQEWSAGESAADILCERIVAGETLTAIAKSLKTTVQSLAYWIAADVSRSARVREARIAAAGSYSDLALQAINEAGEPFELARARELAQHYRWKASKADPRTYGDKLDLTAEIGIKALPDDVLQAETMKLARKLGIIAAE